MNYLWAFMILSGVIFSAFHGTIPAVTGAVLDSAKEAVTLCITMTGVLIDESGENKHDATIPVPAPVKKSTIDFLYGCLIFDFLCS